MMNNIRTLLHPVPITMENPLGVITPILRIQQLLDQRYRYAELINNNNEKDLDEKGVNIYV